MKTKKYVINPVSGRKVLAKGRVGKQVLKAGAYPDSMYRYGEPRSNIIIEIANKEQQLYKIGGESGLYNIQLPNAVLSFTNVLSNKSLDGINLHIFIIKPNNL